MSVAPAAAPRSFGHAEVFATLGALSFLAARFLPVLDLGLECPFRALVGIPCATCGMTHAFVHAARLEVMQALRASPAGALLAAGAWLFAAADAARLALGWRWPAPGPRLARALAAVAVAALLANWAFLVVAHRA
jgi:hypothetical protein